MKGPIQHCDRTIEVYSVSILTVSCESAVQPHDKIAIYWLPIEIPHPTLCTHQTTPLASLPYAVDHLNVRTLIDCFPADFYPGVALKRKFLRTNDQLGRDTATA